MKKGRWSFVHGGTQTHSDLVFPVAEDRRILKDLEGSRNTADYEEGQFSEDEVREMITDAEALLRTLGFRP